jgi:hypothetical protein
MSDIITQVISHDSNNSGTLGIISTHILSMSNNINRIDLVNTIEDIHNRSINAFSIDEFEILMSNVSSEGLTMLLPLIRDLTLNIRSLDVTHYELNHNLT